MQKPIIIGIGYKKGNGKNCLCTFLSTYLRCTYPKLKITEISFAGKLKDIAFQLYGHFGVKRAIYYETHREEKEQVLPTINKSPRQIYIELGNAIRSVYMATWIDYALKCDKCDIILVSDLGFTNEAKAIRDKGGKLIKIMRNGQQLGTDPREVELDSWFDWDSVIDNNGSLDDLYNKAVQLWLEIENGII